MSRKKLFCELGPAAYAISLQRQILKRKLSDTFSKTRFASCHDERLLPVVVCEHRGDMIKRGPGIDEKLQYNKADNIRLACSRIDRIVINPGETFSFWKLVGKTSKRNGFTEGRILKNGKLVAGLGGGLCNLANTLHLLFIHSPLTAVEVHHHSDALAPDPGGIRVPYSAGTSVNYNFIDLRFRNDTDQPVQLHTYCDGDDLCCQLLTTAEFPYTYGIVEEGHHFHLDDNGNYYRISRIYRETIERATGKTISRELKWDNRSRVMFDPSLLPPDQIR